MQEGRDKNEKISRLKRNSVVSFRKLGNGVTDRSSGIREQISANSRGFLISEFCSSECFTVERVKLLTGREHSQTGIVSQEQILLNVFLNWCLSTTLFCSSGYVLKRLLSLFCKADPLTCENNFVSHLPGPFRSFKCHLQNKRLMGREIFTNS